MNKDWQPKKLRDILNIKHGYPFKGEFFSTNGKYVLLTPGNFFEAGGFKRVTAKDKYYLGEFPEEYIHKKDDLIVAMTEQAEGLLGSCALIPEDDLYLHNQRLGHITMDEKEIDKKFIYYLFQMKYIRKQIRLTSTGSKVKHTSPERIYDVEVFLPSFIEQQNIASILSTLDKKIELNNQINQELEAMAKTLYDYWFVQFDFPDTDENPYKSSGGKMVYSEELKREIPEGWKIKKVKDIAKVIMGQSPKSESYNDARKGIPLINGAADYKNGSLIARTYTTSPTRLCKKNDLVFCIRATIGNLTFAEKEYCLGRGVAAVRVNEKILGEILFYMLLQEIERFKIHATGSIIKGITRDDLRDSYIAIPKNSIIEKFHAICFPIFSLQRKKKKENQKLTQLRDWLLPMLMNGQVSVADTKEQVDELMVAEPVVGYGESG